MDILHDFMTFLRFPMNCKLNIVINHQLDYPIISYVISHITSTFSCKVKPLFDYLFKSFYYYVSLY